MNIRNIITGKALGAVMLSAALLCWGGSDNQPIYDGTSQPAARLQSAAKISIEMVRIPGGTFMMGSESSEAISNERPVHPVTVSGFEIGKYEVTQAEWASVMGGAHPSFFKTGGDTLPVEKVSWNDVQGFIRKLNQKTGLRYRLPTEAEWEYACRAGTTGDRYGSIDSIAWYYGNSGGRTHEVGGKTPNGFGLYDMLGNVLEWCQDWYGVYSAGAQNNPPGAGSGSSRVYRGGSWNHFAQYARASLRRDRTPSYRDLDLGFRLARD
jgi:formylglycine-generating enzyme required for sulfatase activity